MLSKSRKGCILHKSRMGYILSESGKGHMLSESITGLYIVKFFSEEITLLINIILFLHRSENILSFCLCEMNKFCSHVQKYSIFYYAFTWILRTMSISVKIAENCNIKTVISH